MKIIDDLNRIESPLKNPVLTIGNFDGVHRGHLALFEKVKERAKAIGGQSAVMTFEPHPIKVMKPGNGPPLITLIEQKLELMSNVGIDVIYCIPFDHEFASISAQDFIEAILQKKIGVKEIVVGYDYSFGNKREGDIELLKRMGEELDIKIHVVDPIYIDEKLVSSTNIRNLVQDGNLKEASTFLGREYQIGGTVVEGRKRGARLLGIPTANLKLIDELIPKKGVYAVTVIFSGDIYRGVTNIGYNPTFGESTLSIETHILDFSENIVGKKIKVIFHQYLRGEKTFKGPEELSTQIFKDIEEAKILLNKTKVD